MKPLPMFHADGMNLVVEWSMKPCDMTKVDAIQASIAKWNYLADHPEIKGDGGRSTCALCQKYWGKEYTRCQECPVYKETGATHCNNTPYNEWSSDRTSKNARREADFLSKLLPEYSFAESQSSGALTVTPRTKIVSETVVKSIPDGVTIQMDQENARTFCEWLGEQTHWYSLYEAMLKALFQKE